MNDDAKPSPAAGPRPHVLVQLSDPHIGVPGERAYGRVDSAPFLQAAVQAVGRLTVPPLAVLVTGDLANHGHPAAYAALKHLLQPLACPVYLLPGNHDKRAALRQAFAEHPWLHAAHGDAPVQYTVALPGLRVVALDSTVPGRSHGALCDERLAWLAAELAAAPDTPTLIAMHHPPFDSHLDYMDAIGLLEGGPALARIVSGAPQVCRIVCGHLHRNVQAQWAGTVVQTAPSTAHQVWFDMAEGRGNGFGFDPPGFLVHAWLPGQPLVTHHVFVAPAEGPYPFRP
ncbi:phosphodiesterase [Pseudorhodoferax sp.]|uniref:phosphodiesterase n=1 Tax=Pseudorhodoferax sp. TaxID=1993553 RepID=UPI002DD67B72|nr:phosphodiesterase [Pseudorhodoferax sp.]